MKKPFLTLTFFLVKLVISAIFVYLAYIIPGSQETSLRFVDYVIDVKTGLLAASAIVIIILAHYLMRFASWVVTLPEKIRSFLARRRIENSKQNILESFVAMAAGEFDSAMDLSHRAQYQDPTNIFAPIFVAQATFMKGDYIKAEYEFKDLLKNPQTRFLGLRGLISLKQKQNKPHEVNELLDQILANRPNSPWVLNLYFTLHINQNAFDKAEAIVPKLKATGAITPERANRYRSILFWLKAKQFLDEDNLDPAETLLLQSVKMTPTLTAATLSLANLYSKKERITKAQKYLIKGYEAQPDPEYLEAIEKLMTQKSALEQFQFAQFLTSPHPQSLDSHLILATLALKAQLWGQARHHLQVLENKRPTESYYRLMAILETNNPQTGSPKNPDYLEDMLHAPQDPQWICQECNSSFKTWVAICPSCTGFDTLQKQDSLPTSPAKNYNLLSFSN